jgi:hypothetical protein
MPQHAKQHRNVRGKTSLLDADQELHDFVLSNYMTGSSPSEIAKMIRVRYPNKPISRITISRFLDRTLDDINPEMQTSDKSSKDLLKQFDDTIEEFNSLFSEIEESVDLTTEQQERLDKHHRRVIMSLNLAKKRWKIFMLQVQMTNTEVQEGLQKFINTLTGKQKLQLNEMLQDMFLEDQLLNQQDTKKYLKYQKSKVKSFYKYFPQKDEGIEVA